jgi:hypothetical protein
MTTSEVTDFARVALLTLVLIHKKKKKLDS